MGTQGTVLVSSALYGNNDEQSHGALLNQNKYDVSRILLIHWNSVFFVQLKKIVVVFNVIN